MIIPVRCFTCNKVRGRSVQCGSVLPTHALAPALCVPAVASLAPLGARVLADQVIRWSPPVRPCRAAGRPTRARVSCGTETRILVSRDTRCC